MGALREDLQNIQQSLHSTVSKPVPDTWILRVQHWKRLATARVRFLSAVYGVTLRAQLEVKISSCS